MIDIPQCILDSQKYHDELTGENGGFISFEKNTFFWLFKES